MALVLLSLYRTGGLGLEDREGNELKYNAPSFLLHKSGCIKGAGFTS